MARSSLTKEGVRRAIALSEWLYHLFLHLYPASFRHVYGLRMARVFRDSCRNTVQRRGPVGLLLLWSHTLSDLVVNACLERWHVLQEVARSMVNHQQAHNFPLRFWIALVTTLIAFTISLVASINLYLLEDASPLTQAAYSASPLLRFSYDAIYLSALAASVAICAIVGYAITQRIFIVMVGLSIIALLVISGGFGGLLIRHPATFLIFFVIFIALLLSGFLLGRVVTNRLSRIFQQRSATILGACTSACILLLINVVALVLHTLILNPVSHALYMQGQIGGTHLNSALIAMGVALLTMIACIISLGRALSFSPHHS